MRNASIRFNCLKLIIRRDIIFSLIERTFRCTSHATIY